MTSSGGETRAVFQRPPHLVDPSGTLAVWFTEPPGMVVQFARRGPCTVELAEWLVATAGPRVLERFPGPEPLAFVLDLSQMVGRDPRARAIITEGVGTLAARAGRTVVVPPVSATRVYLASLHVAASLARVLGITVSVEPLPQAVHALHAAPLP